MASGVRHFERPDKPVTLIGHDVGFVAERGDRNIHLAFERIVFLTAVLDGPAGLRILLRRLVRVVPDVFCLFSGFDRGFLLIRQTPPGRADEAGVHQLSVGRVIA